MTGCLEHLGGVRGSDIGTEGETKNTVIFHAEHCCKDYLVMHFHNPCAAISNNAQRFPKVSNMFGRILTLSRVVNSSAKSEGTGAWESCWMESEGKLGKVCMKTGLEDNYIFV